MWGGGEGGGLGFHLDISLKVWRFVVLLGY